MNQQNHTYQSPSIRDPQEEEFFLEGEHSTADADIDTFALEQQEVDNSLCNAPIQESLALYIESPEFSADSKQIGLEGMGKPIHQVVVHQVDIATGIEHAKTINFQNANTLLDSIEAQDIPVHYQCREGYCGSCRTQLLEGEVHYTEEPMAWINDDEILPCCCIPKTAIRIKLT